MQKDPSIISMTGPQIGRTGFLNYIQTITKIGVPGKALLYYFKIIKTGGDIVYVAWEKRDAFSGED